MHSVSVEVARGLDGVIILDTSLRITVSLSENPVFWVNLLAWASAPAGAEGGGECRVFIARKLAHFSPLLRAGLGKPGAGKESEWSHNHAAIWDGERQRASIQAPSRPRKHAPRNALPQQARQHSSMRLCAWEFVPPVAQPRKMQTPQASRAHHPASHPAALARCVAARRTHRASGPGPQPGPPGPAWPTQRTSSCCWRGLQWS